MTSHASTVLCQGTAGRLKQEVAELLETLLRLHAAYSDAAVEESDTAHGGFPEAAASQLPLFLSAYGAATSRGLFLTVPATLLIHALAGRITTLPPTDLPSVGP